LNQQMKMRRCAEISPTNVRMEPTRGWAYRRERKVVKGRRKSVALARREKGGVMNVRAFANLLTKPNYVSRTPSIHGGKSLSTACLKQEEKRKKVNGRVGHASKEGARFAPERRWGLKRCGDLGIAAGAGKKRGTRKE